MTKNSSVTLATGQFLHFSLLAILLACTWYFWIKIDRPHAIFFWASIAIPIVHQIFTWISWRTELSSKTISKRFGVKNYFLLFFILLIARPIFHFALALVDQNSLHLGYPVRIGISIVLIIPAVYTMYSVKKYFSFTRAAGADHFDKAYRKLPLVKMGIFKYSKNSMYVLGFLMFWAIAIACNSKAALLSSAFAHAYIWVHYYATEKPDMNFIYQ